MEIKILKFTATESDPFTGGDDRTYTFKGYELPTGEVWVDYENSNNAYFMSRDEVEASGGACVTGVEETGDTFDIADDDLREAIAGSAREYGLEAVPESLHKYVATQQV